MPEKDSWNIYYSSDAAWKAMLEDSAAAKKSIDFEQYLFVSDEVGLKFATILMAKAKEGVRVRLLLDGAGSFGMFMSALSDEMRRAGVQVLFFNPISPWRVHNILSWYFRDHRKMMVIDGSVGHVGGVCVDGEMSGWRDTHIRIKGSVVEEMELAFSRIWLHAESGERNKLPFSVKPSGNFSFLTNSPRLHERFIYHAMLKAISSAKEKVWLTSPYFIPDPRFFRVIRLAARRGVDVRLLVSGPSDHRFVDIASHSYYQRAFRAGIRIFRYETARLHAKSVIVDDFWATVGTTNLDNLSLLFNYECNVAIKDKKMISELSRQFEEDIKISREVFRREWKHRPLSEKILEKIMWPFHRFL